MRLDLNRTLEQLESENWDTNDFSSGLIQKIYEVRRKPLNKLSVEDLRIAIGQNCGLTYLIPLAIVELQKNILAEGDFYPGDLLKNVLSSDRSYWKAHKSDWLEVTNLFEKNRQELEADDSFKQIIKSFTDFKLIDSNDK